MIKREPNVDWVGVIGGGFVFLGFLLFLIALNVTTLNTTGDTRSVLEGAFTIFVGVYTVSGVLALAGVIIQLLRWLTWAASTPVWAKNKMKEDNKK